LIGSVNPKVLVQDLLDLKNTKSSADLPVKVVPVRGGAQTWVRFHSKEDRPGLFLGYVKWLAASGLAVRHASILTDAELGVYDWFEVKTTKRAAQIVKLLEAAMKSSSEKSYSVKFDSVEAVATDDREWVMSFRGRDQNGALTEAARALFEAGAAIRWAKVHTWGRQIDDVFGIAPLKGVDSLEFVVRLRSVCKSN
jgi:[protein-PII] uridylyltransferase